MFIFQPALSQANSLWDWQWNDSHETLSKKANNFPNSWAITLRSIPLPICKTRDLLAASCPCVGHKVHGLYLEDKGMVASQREHSHLFSWLIPFFTTYAVVLHCYTMRKATSILVCPSSYLKMLFLKSKNLDFISCPVLCLWSDLW